MAKNYSQAKGRSNRYTFVMLTHQIMDSDNYMSLSGKALRLLLDLARQYKGYNNGDLCASRSVLKKRQWTSNSSIGRALSELLEKGWITETRKGGLGIGCSLYALTWQPIDECKGKLEVRPTRTASHDWKYWNSKNTSPNTSTDTT